jgi:DNA polymerase III sliding clamp (beta) subunit (PCNA family)
VLTGLYAELANDRFTLIAADSYCLAMRQLTLSRAGSREHGALVATELLRRAIRALLCGH